MTDLGRPCSELPEEPSGNGAAPGNRRVGGEVERLRMTDFDADLRFLTEEPGFPPGRVWQKNAPPGAEAEFSGGDPAIAPEPAEAARPASTGLHGEERISVSGARTDFRAPVGGGIRVGPRISRSSFPNASAGSWRFGSISAARIARRAGGEAFLRPLSRTARSSRPTSAVPMAGRGRIEGSSARSASRLATANLTRPPGARATAGAAFPGTTSSGRTRNRPQDRAGRQR